MACFLVTAAEAAVVAAAEKAEEKREENESKNGGSEKVAELRIPLSRKLKWLTYMLVGGAVLLAFEHVWHGEVVPWFPFLTAMAPPEDAAEMLHEMLTVGVCMSVLVTAVWFGICKAADAIIRRPARQAD